MPAILIFLRLPSHFFVGKIRIKRDEKKREEKEIVCVFTKPGSFFPSPSSSDIWLPVSDRAAVLTVFFSL